MPLQPSVSSGVPILPCASAPIEDLQTPSSRPRRTFDRTFEWGIPSFHCVSSFGDTRRGASSAPSGIGRIPREEVPSRRTFLIRPRRLRADKPAVQVRRPFRTPVLNADIQTGWARFLSTQIPNPRVSRSSPSRAGLSTVSANPRLNPQSRWRPRTRAGQLSGGTGTCIRCVLRPVPCLASPDGHDAHGMAELCGYRAHKSKCL